MAAELRRGHQGLTGIGQVQQHEGGQRVRPLGLAGYLFGGLGEPALQVRADRCLRASGSSCRACVDICPATALRLGPKDSTEAPQSEQSRCTDCGLCAATCPSGAIAGVGVPPGALTREAERQSSTINLVCAPARPQRPRDEENPDFSVSCLAALHPETVVATALALKPGSTLTLHRGQCSGCPRAQQARVEAVVRESVDLLRRLDHGDRTLALAITPDAPNTQQQMPARPSTAARRGWSRRELLTARRSGARAATAPAVTPARAELLHHIADPSSVPLQLIHPLDAKGCTFCHACAAVCPTQALRIGRLPTDNTEPQGSMRLELAVDPARCLGCGRCAQVCVDDLLTLGRGLGHAMRHQGPARGRVVIAQGNRSSCDTCAQPLAPNEQGICRRCESSGTLVADVRSRFSSAPTAHEELAVHEGASQPMSQTNEGSSAVTQLSPMPARQP
ncbi:MAG: 4Fe-4S dicluster domain-containing protein [Phycicoccus sp.]|nr:4Fe-4S dicluster domain-containing protein [Phycicoccus sp.]